MPEKIDLTLAFSLPPEEAIEYFRGKGYKITFNWAEMWHEAHAKAFTVSRVASMDILTDIRKYTDIALSEGWSLQRYQLELEETLRRKGWWGLQEVIDPITREIKETIFNPSRLELIYRNNLQVAYATGNYKQAKEVANERPYWQYRSVNDGRTRPLHRAWNGITLRHDDPWWDTHHPPNGWNCRCRIRTLSQRQLDKEGITLSNSESLNNQFPLVDWTDPATGLTKKVPSGIDPGWDYNPGKDSFLG